ncbi:hypothetical protein FRC12_010768 [Ceratobasidium sp. 428]|nr:hypothetical protein FRC12_010768 [Ceratobasidium sp. 428]
MQRAAFRPIGDHRRPSTVPLHAQPVTIVGIDPAAETAHICGNGARPSFGAPGYINREPAPGTTLRPLRLASPVNATGRPPANTPSLRGGNHRGAPIAPPNPDPSRATGAAIGPPPGRTPQHTPGAAQNGPPKPMPMAAGFPIGAIPVDGVSALVMRELAKHVNDDPDTRKNSMAQMLKLSTPPAYSGETESTKFMDWVTKVIRYCRLAGLWGPSHDRTRVDLIGHCCDGPALTWFNREVETAEGGPDAWTTLEVIQGLQARFITQRSAAEAGKAYRRLKQEDLDVQEFYHELCALARQLPDHPSQYEFNHRFYRGLRAEVADKVTDFCVSAEQNSTEEMLKAAIDAEAALAMRRISERNKLTTKTTSAQEARKKFQTKERSTTTAAAASVEKKSQPSCSNTAGKSERKGKSGSGNCFNCNWPGHQARNCPQSQSITGKAAAVVQGDNQAIYRIARRTNMPYRHLK